MISVSSMVRFCSLQTFAPVKARSSQWTSVALKRGPLDNVSRGRRPTDARGTEPYCDYMQGSLSKALFLCRRLNDRTLFTSHFWPRKACKASEGLLGHNVNVSYCSVAETRESVCVITVATMIVAVMGHT